MGAIRSKLAEIVPTDVSKVSRIAGELANLARDLKGSVANFKL